MDTATAPGTVGEVRKFRGRAIQCDEAKAPEFFQFKAVPDSIDGMLLSIQKVKVKDKEVIEYTIEREDGSRAKVLATADLAQKISMRHRGGFISITFVGTDETVSKNGNAMRRFDVFTEHRGGPAAANPEITDEDIPF